MSGRPSPKTTEISESDDDDLDGPARWGRNDITVSPPRRSVRSVGGSVDRDAVLITAGLVAAYLVLLVAGVTVAVPSVERHLERDVREHVLRDLPALRARADGRTIRLDGVVASNGELEQLRRRVRQRWGVAAVDVRQVSVARST